MMPDARTVILNRIKPLFNNDPEGGGAMGAFVLRPHWCFGLAEMQMRSGLKIEEASMLCQWSADQPALLKSTLEKLMIGHLFLVKKMSVVEGCCRTVDSHSRRC